MNENTLNLVSAIIKKDATEIESSFNAAMAEKISARLDDMHTAVAQGMFKSEEAVVEEELTEQEYEDILNEGELGKAVKAHADAAMYHDQFGGNRAEVKSTREKMHALAKERGIKPSRATKVANKMINRAYGESYEIDEATGMKKKKKWKAAC